MMDKKTRALQKSIYLEYMRMRGIGLKNREAINKLAQLYPRYTPSGIQSIVYRKTTPNENKLLLESRVHTLELEVELLKAKLDSKQNKG